MTADPTNTYVYDAESRITSTTNTHTGVVSSYVYDASGQRVRKTSGSVSVDYIYDLAGHVVAEVNSTGGWTRGEVFAGGRHLATYNNNTTYFIHADWLGTERARSNTAGTSCETITSLPFGDNQATSGTCSDASPLHFTGKQRDPESGLDNFDARYNSSSIGRFMSPDPLGILSGETASPQSLNLYSYVQDNPVNAVDPDGLDCVYISGNYAYYNTGSCISGMNGTYVNGAIDPKSASYDPNTGTLSFNYANGDTGSVGQGVIGNVYPSGGVSDADRLNAVGLGTRIAAPGVNLAFNLLRAFGYAVAAPLMVAAECAAGAPSCTKGNIAMALLPELGALREGALLAEEGAALGKGAEILQKGGGAAQAAKDYESLQGVEKIYGTTKVKTLSDGTRAVLYQSTGGSGQVTLAIQDAAGRTVTKFRY